MVVPKVKSVEKAGEEIKSVVFGGNVGELLGDANSGGFPILDFSREGDLREDLKGENFKVAVGDRVIGTTGFKEGHGWGNLELTKELGQKLINREYESEPQDATQRLGINSVKFINTDTLEDAKEKVKETAKQADETASNYSNLTSFLIAIPALLGLAELLRRRFM